MKKTFVVALVLVLLPSFASAHEEQVFRINGEGYQFVVGSLGEPLLVDDKSGVDLSITKCAAAACTPLADDSVGSPVEGLDETLKVELQAGDAKRVLDLSPQWGEPGAYKAVFIPTVATTLSYRVFGSIDGTDVDLTFTCSAAGHETAKEETTETQMSDGVVRVSKTGAFGCPTAREEKGFPEPSANLHGLVHETEGAKGFGTAGVALSVLALALAAYAVGKKK